MDIHRPDEQGFIPFIHNYCDRRCERCRFVRQCRVGIIEIDDVDEDRTEVADDRVEDRAERLRKVLGLPPEDEGPDEPDEDLQDWLAEIGALAPPPDPEADARHQAIRRAATEHPIAVLALAYADQVSDWMGPREAMLRVRGVRRDQREELLIDPALRTPDALLLSEAVEEVLWFQHMLYVKGQRALIGKLEQEADPPDEDFDPLQSDWNGTTKLALHIVDRSVTAWNLLAERLPDEATSIAPLIAHLEECGAALHREFPDAERFIRPGFDAP